VRTSSKASTSTLALHRSAGVQIGQISLKPSQLKRRGYRRGSGIVPATSKTANADDALRILGGGDAVFHGPGDAGPSTTVSTSNGATFTNVQVQLILWGSVWNDPATVPSASQVVGAVSSILSGPYMNKLGQYGAGQGSLAGAWILSSPNPNNPFSDSDVADMTWNLIDNGNFPEPDDSGGGSQLLMFIMPPGVATTSPFGGEHSTAHDTDLFDGDDQPYAWVTNDGTIDTVTQIFSHELAEAVSDPAGDAWQVDPRNSSSWHEICDVCQSVADLNGVSVASYFSASDGACVIPGLQSTGPLGRYCAIFRSRPASWDILPNWDLSSVQAQIATDSANGIYPATLDGFEDNGVLRLASVSRSGPATQIEGPTDWATMTNLISQRAANGWLMTSIDAYLFNGQRKFLGVFQQASGRYVIVPDWDWGSMYNEIGSLAQEGFRMNSIAVFVENGTARYAGVFLDGSDSMMVVPDWDWNTMYQVIPQNEAAGRVLVSLDSFTVNGVTRYAGVFRESGDAYEIVPNWTWADLYNEINSCYSRGLYMTEMRDCSIPD
jgi:hypothetical protein